jgi:hypothetical protein
VPAPSFNSEVFHGSASGIAATTTITLTLTSDVVGSLLFLSLLTSGSSVSSVVDSKGNSWAVATNGLINGARRLTAVTGQMNKPLKTGDIITVTMAATITSWAASVLDYSNAHWRAAGIDTATAGTGTSTAPASGNPLASSIADSLVVGVTGWNNTTTTDWSAGAGFTGRGTKVTDGTNAVAVEDKIVSATGTYPSNATLANSSAWCQVVVVVCANVRWYVDYSKADNTGAGTSWATAKKDLSSVSPKSGDIVTMAKSSDPTSLSGTMTFTDNSTSVSTSSDLSATLAAKDMIGPYTGSDELAGDGWWEVSSVTSSTVTLNAAYSGTTRSSVTGYRSNGFDAGSPATSTTSIVAFNTGAGAQASLIKAIGGYDTGTDTRTGMTHFRVSSATKNGQCVLASSWQEFQYVGVSRCNRGFIWNASSTGCKNCFTSNTGSDAWEHVSSNAVWADTCYVYRAGGHGFNLLGGSYNGIFNSVVQNAANNGISFTNGNAYSFADNCTIRRTGSQGITTNSTPSRNILVRNCTINNCSTGVNFNGAENILSSGTYASNTTDVGNGSASGWRNYVFSASVSSTTSYSSGVGTTGGWTFVDRDNQAAQVYKQLIRDGTIKSNTVNARGGSGHCVELVPNNAAGGGPLEYVVPIPSDASGTRTVTVWMAADSGWNGDVLNVGLRVNGIWQGTAPTARTSSSVARWPQQ